MLLDEFVPRFEVSQRHALIRKEALRSIRERAQSGEIPEPGDRRA
jgi:hypothetical protein